MLGLRRTNSSTYYLITLPSSILPDHVRSARFFFYNLSIRRSLGKLAELGIKYSCPKSGWEV